MNERPSTADRDRLLADAYHEDWTAGPAGALATHAARTVRGRRTIRRMVVTAAAGVLLASSAWWFSFSPERVAPPSARPVGSSRSVSSAQAGIPPRGYEIISDAELMAYLRDQPAMILTGADGQKKVILLDDQEPAAAEAPSA
jgi:hypothetical protein